MPAIYALKYFVQRLFGLQKVAFQSAKGHLSHCRRPPFMGLPTVFLTGNAYSFAMWRWQNGRLCISAVILTEAARGFQGSAFVFLFVKTFYCSDCIFIHGFSDATVKFIDKKRQK